MRKFKFPILVLLLVVTALPIMLCACNDNKAKIIEIDGWKLVKDDIYYSIVDMSENLVKQKEVAIPSELNGRHILKVDFRNFEIFKEYSVDKMFFPDAELHLTFRFCADDDGTDICCPKTKKIIFVTTDNNRYHWSYVGSSKEFLEMGYKTAAVYVPSKALDSFWFWGQLHGYATVFAANVSFFYNYSAAPNDGYYWIDDLEQGEKFITIPKNPTRDHYTFTGWYRDSECTEPIDFESFTMNGSTLNLYAGWRSISAID